jgi:carboxymethylenebutenolidase
VERIEIRTEDGVCPIHVFHPAGRGPLPAVLLFMDGVGIRPALFEMGERLASAGYHVLLPDLFYRAGPYEPMNAKTVWSDLAQRQALMSKFMSTTSVANVMRDTRTFLDHLAADSRAKGPRVGITGYCMGGRMALAAAGHFPDRIAAAAAYHPGNPASDAPDSPHLLAAKMKARVYVAGAAEDATFPDVQKERLGLALVSAGVEHVVETYPARHGWVPSDTPAHDPVQAERHWKTLLELLASSLVI